MYRRIDTGEEIPDVLGMYMADEREAPGRPWVMINFVTSIDGATKVRGGSTGLNDEDDKRLFGFIRATADIVLVGAGTIRAEGYGPLLLDETRREARAKAGLPDLPKLVIATRRLDLDPDAKVFSDPQHKPMVITGSDADPERLEAISEVSELAQTDDLGPGGILAELGEARVVLCEGGPTLAGQFASAGLVDEVHWTVAPLLVSGDSKRMTPGDVIDPPQEMTLSRMMMGDRSLFLRYVRA